MHISLRIKLHIFWRMFLNITVGIIVNINSFIAPNISVNITSKYYFSQALNEKLKLIRETTIFFSKKLLGHKIFSSMVPWITKFYLKNL